MKARGLFTRLFWKIEIRMAILDPVSSRGFSNEILRSIDSNNRSIPREMGDATAFLKSHGRSEGLPELPTPKYTQLSIIGRGILN